MSRRVGTAAFRRPPSCSVLAPTRSGGSAPTRATEAVQASGAAFLTQTTLRGRFALRACVLHYATTEADVAALVDVVRETGAHLTEGLGEPSGAGEEAGEEPRRGGSRP